MRGWLIKIRDMQKKVFVYEFGLKVKENHQIYAKDVYMEKPSLES